MERNKRDETIKRFSEFLNNSRNHHTYYFTDFMTAQDAADVHSIGDGREITVFGGSEMSERVMIRFGDPEDIGYEQPFPIVLLMVRPTVAKFAEQLTHRDYLGTLMGLGIERDIIGDITIKENAAYIFVAKRMAEYLVGELVRVRHTSVTCEVLSEIPDDLTPTFTEEELIVPSLRLDAIIAKVFHLSRQQTKQLFTKEAVLVNGRVVKSGARTAEQGIIVSVRGYGKWIFDAIPRETKKGNIVVDIRRYI